MEKKMKGFVPVSAPSEMDFYQIYEGQDGVKRIHILAFLFERDPDEDEKDLKWGFVDFGGIDMTLEEFVAGAAQEGGYKFAVRLEEEARQWQMDMPAEDAVRWINTYFGGEPADYVLGFDDVTIDTPCGCYVA